MINLLSPTAKHELRAARRNVILLRYNIIILLTIIAVACIYGGGFFITMRAKAMAETQLREDQARTSSYRDVQQTAQQYAKNLSTAKTILSNEIVYSILITDIAKILPSGTVLSNLNLSPDAFGKPMTISASVKNYDKALELKAALEKSELFSDANIENVSQIGEGDGASGYPINVTLKATFATEEQVKALRGESL